MTTGDGLSLWNEEDGFFYDALHLPDGRVIPLKVRSLVGLMPLLAVETLEHDLVESLPVFKRRMNWFFENRIYLRDSGNVACVKAPGQARGGCFPSSIANTWLRLLRPMLDENEFLSEFGIRSLSKYPSRPPLHLSRRRPGLTPSATNRLNRKAVFSAAIQTGADRSGFRSITC